MPTSEQWAVLISLLLLLTLGVVFPLSLVFKESKGTFMNDTVKRTLRTFLQSFVGVLVTTLVPFLYDLVQAAGEADGELVRIDVNFIGNVLIAAVVAGIISLITLAQNLLEDNTPVQILPK